MKKFVAFLVVVFSVFTSFWMVIKQWVKAWTANADEAEKPLAGDDIIENPKIRMTNAVSIQATPEHIWQWLVQMGAERAGWYSYDELDNEGVPSAEEILPEYQDLEEGDVVKALPNTEGGFKVVKIRKPFELVYTTFTPLHFDKSGERTTPEEPYYWRTTWAFVLSESSEDVTRLLVRARVSYNLPDWIVPIAQLLAYPVHFIMQQRQLANIRNRAEAFYADEIRLKQATVHA